MKDLLTYVADLTAFREELKATDSPFIHTDEEEGSTSISVDLGITIYKENESLSICRCDEAKEAFLRSLSNLQVIGQDTGGEEFTFTEGGKEIYGAMYDTTPRTFTDEDGMVFTYTPPKKFCVFAS